jgi:lipooligosaccharide transport system ATP-binding protein
MSDQPTPPLIHARGLTKRFGEFVAVDAVDFDVAPGESFGFLGPNGAGKTSTMRMIGCVSPISDGTLTVMGLDPNRHGPQIRARLGVVPQQDALDVELTVRENLVLYGRYFGLSRAECGRRADELLDFAQLTERQNDEVEPLSGGMKPPTMCRKVLLPQPLGPMIEMNSPGRAARAPALSSSATSRSTSGGQETVCNSTTSCPVYERGPGNRIRSAGSGE